MCDSKNKHNNIQRMTIISLLLALTMTIKLALNQIAGVELITFTFIVIGLYLTVSEVALFTLSFYILVNLFEGFNLIYVPYLFIFSITAYTSKLFWKLDHTKKIWFGVMTITPIITLLSYFVWDSIIFDPSYALLNVIGATPILFVGIVTNVIALITLTPAIKNVLDKSIYTKNVSDKEWIFKRNYLVAPITTIAIATTSVLIYPSVQLFISNQINDATIKTDDTSSFKKINERAMNETEYLNTLNDLSDSEISLQFYFNKNDDVKNDIEKFIYKFDLNLLEGESKLINILKYINTNNNNLKVILKNDLLLGTSIRNFIWNNKEYGNDSYCGFNYINNKNVSVGIDHLTIKPKSIIVFDYHLLDIIGSGYCRY